MMMEFDEKLKQERKKILSTFFAQWLEGEQAKCDKIKDEITELAKQRDNRIIEIAKDDYPKSEINSITDVDWILNCKNDGFISSGALEKYSYYTSVKSLNKKIEAKQNELDLREPDVTRARKFDNGVEFLSKVDEAEQLESEVKQAESELNELKKRLKSVREDTTYKKTLYIEEKNSYDKLLKEFEESHKEVTA